MNNQSALDRLKEIEAEKKEIEAALLDQLQNSEFPIYCKKDNGLHKMVSKSEALSVSSSHHGFNIQHRAYSSITHYTWDDYVSGKTEPITPEEFEAARAEAINKLSNL